MFITEFVHRYAHVSLHSKSASQEYYKKCWPSQLDSKLTSNIIIIKTLTTFQTCLLICRFYPFKNIFHILILFKFQFYLIHEHTKFMVSTSDTIVHSFMLVHERLISTKSSDEPKIFFHRALILVLVMTVCRTHYVNYHLNLRLDNKK